LGEMGPSPVAHAEHIRGPRSLVPRKTIFELIVCVAWALSLIFAQYFDGFYYFEWIAISLSPRTTLIL